MANENLHNFSKYDWVLDLAMTSHICTIQDAFIDYGLLNSESTLKLDGKSIRNIFQNVLHVPKAPNCLISIPHLAIGGGWVTSVTHFRVPMRISNSLN
ncbi:hypothetical protein K443DRAFT_106057 [Laccaria amethystina LaAM-08-1]|uniref:Uncharacterized protein n=1 Tax=Laccaria amethystina LaAM-08-1 TaxID=1095629 RepID=A0A0C9WWZ3_9AGAR|nr:hypothetical protein K443DRAFT_106057 [Laccaria amethystina LaAM-08-1]